MVLLVQKQSNKAAESRDSKKRSNEQRLKPQPKDGTILTVGTLWKDKQYLQGMN